MSVVNTMLRELAARQPPVDGAISPPLAVVTPLATGISATATPRRWPWWFLAMLILAVLIAGWRWSQANRSEVTPATTLDSALLETNPLEEAAPNTTAANPASVPAAAMGQTRTEPVQTTETATLPAVSEPVANTTSQSASNLSSNSSKHPASIGWELVQIEDDELSGFDENESWSDGALAATDAPTDTATATAKINSAAAPVSHFDRQPASLTLEEQLQQQREQARLALTSNDPSAARAAIMKGLQLRSDDEQLLALQLQSLAQTDPAGARQQAEQLLQVQPQQWRIRQWLGTEQLQQQQVAQAKATLQTAAPLLSIAPDYHAVLALAEQQSGDHHAAANRYRQLLLAQPQHGRHSAGLALSLDAIGERNAAIAAWRRALTDPALPAAVARFGQQRLQLFTSPATQASP